MTVTVIKPTDADAHFSTKQRSVKIFLAGSIEMGKAEDWQSKLIKRIQDANLEQDIIVYSPRRDNWDSSWKQSEDNPQFFDQVTWELTNLVNADIAFFWFDPNTLSPISMLEFGMMSTSERSHVVVYCPKEFWRKGNIDVTAKFFRNRNNVFDHSEEAINRLMELIQRANQ